MPPADKSASRTNGPMLGRPVSMSVGQGLDFLCKRSWPYTWWASKGRQRSCSGSTPLSQESSRESHVPKRGQRPRCQGLQLPDTCTKSATPSPRHRRIQLVVHQESYGTVSLSPGPSGPCACLGKLPVCRCPINQKPRGLDQDLRSATEHPSYYKTTTPFWLRQNIFQMLRHLVSVLFDQVAMVWHLHFGLRPWWSKRPFTSATSGSTTSSCWRRCRGGPFARGDGRSTPCTTRLWLRWVLVSRTSSTARTEEAGA